MIKLKWFLLFIFVEILIAGGVFYYWKFVRVLPDTPVDYYTIFNKYEILDGSETTAAEVNEKLDKRLDQYQKSWINITGTEDPVKLKALFYMNFVRMYGFYGPRELKETSLKEILWGGEYFQCGTFTTFLSMLLDQAGYEFRTVSIGGGAHGYVEIKFDGNWQILDPTINLWIDKSTEDLLKGESRNEKRFFLKTFYYQNPNGADVLLQVANVFNLMTKMGLGYQPKIDQYNYIDLKQYQY